MKRVLVFVSLILLLDLTPSAQAELPPAQEAAAKQVFFEVLSPFCPGRSLNDCPSASANDLKNEIRGMVQAGQSREQIVGSLIARFGDEIRAVPNASGFDLVAWLAPTLFLALGALVVAFWLRRNSSANKTSTTTPYSAETTLDAAIQERIAAELRRSSD